MDFCTVELLVVCRRNGTAVELDKIAGLKICQGRKENANEELGDALKTILSKPRPKCFE